MLKKLIYPILLAALLGPIFSCNSSSDDDPYTYVESTAVTVTGFSLANDKKVLDSLQNVFFSIDLVGARIFNADSLPYGTKISRLVPVINVASSASAVSLTYFCEETGRDSIVDYMTNSTDSIDFSKGPVKLTVTSQSGAVKRDYQISVNVHQVKADTLAWYSLASMRIPSTFSKLQGQRTAELNGTYYCLSTDGNGYCVATTTDPSDTQWQMREVTMPFKAKVASLNASDDALYILDTEGNLYKSTDCQTWENTGQNWHYIYGGYCDQILGCVTSESGNTINSYPSGKVWPMPAEFPIEGTSQIATYTLSMGYAPQMVMLGGRQANSLLTKYAWSFDGNEWFEISTKPLPTALEQITMVPYQLVDIPSSTWAPKSYPVLLAFGGIDNQGSINRNVYYSRDWGMTWNLAPETVQLPNTMPTFYGASAFVYTTVMHTSRSNDGWAELPLGSLPPQCRYVLPASSRAVAPITQWDCPAIYLFGGRNYDGETLDKAWRGVIRLFTFVPVQ